MFWTLASEPGTERRERAWEGSGREQVMVCMCATTEAEKAPERWQPTLWCAKFTFRFYMKRTEKQYAGARERKA